MFYTTFIREAQYSTQYPAKEMFGDSNKKCIYVHQGWAESAQQNEYLLSEGFSYCSALILRDNRTKTSVLFHIDDWSMSAKAYSVLKHFIHNYLTSLNGSDKEVLQRSIPNQYENPTNMSPSEFQTQMQNANHHKDLRGKFIFGSISRNVKSQFLENYLNQFAISIEDDIFVETNDVHWGLTYQSPLIQVNSRKYKRVLSYNF